MDNEGETSISLGQRQQAVQTSVSEQSISPAVQKFIKCLREAEESKNPENLVEVFDANAELWRQSLAKSYRGPEGALQFWKEYLSYFEDIHSDFQMMQEREGLAVLEWESHGHLKGGQEVHYRGVSILNFEANAKVKRFRSYFDSSALVIHSVESIH